MRYWLVFLLLLTLPTWAQTVRLEVHASPPEAPNVVDREIRGVGNATVDLAPGKHLVRVSAGESWLPQSREMNLTGNTKLSVSLEPGAKRLLERGRALLHQGKDAEAEALFLKASTQPRQVEPFWWLGIAHWKQSEWEPALAAFRRYAQYLGNYPELYLFLGDCQQHLGRQAEAFTAYKSALLLRPEWKNALAGLPPSTEANLRKAGAPKDALGQLRLGQMLMLKGMLGPAVDWVQAALADVYPGWRERDWSAVDPARVAAPPDPNLPVEGPQH